MIVTIKLCIYGGASYLLHYCKVLKQIKWQF